MATETFHHLSLTNYWTDPFSWDPNGTPGAADAAVIAGDPIINADVGSIASLTITSETVNGVAEPVGSVTIKDGGALTVNGDVIDGSTINLYGFTHGAALTIKGSLILNGGHLGLDSSNGPGNETVTINAMQATNESFTLIGGVGTVLPLSLAKVLINTAAGFSAVGVLDGAVRLSGNAVLSFLTGQITTLTSSAILSLYGPKAFLASGDLVSNSALRGLASNAGYLTLDDGAVVQTSGGLINNGHLAVDFDAFGLPKGGSTLKIAGALTNTGAASILNIGSDASVAPTLVEATTLNNTQLIEILGGAQAIAELRIDSAASFGTTGVLKGDVNLSGHALLDFTTGQITSIATGASLTLYGANAFVADVTDESRNSALDGLTSLAGLLTLAGGASAALTGSLNASGGVDLEGGGALSVHATLTNTSVIGVGAESDTAGSTLTAGNVSNSGVIAVNSAVTLLTSNDSVGGGLSSLTFAALTGGGAVDLYANATLELSGAGDNAVVFSGANAVFKLDHPALGYTGAISGFSRGDTLDLANEVVTIQSYNGTTLAVRTSGGATQSFALAGPAAGSLIARSDGAGGTDIIVRSPVTAPGDFNSDGKSDILWRNTSGATVEWNSNASGGYAGLGLYALDQSWQVAGSGDFNGDGKSDILWRNTNGAIVEWVANAGGGVTGVGLGTLDASWQIAGVGDFNGDGKSDILWRNTNGAIVEWVANTSGGVTGVSLGTLDSSWRIAGVGDFNGDGKSDILWRNTSGAIVRWDSRASGGVAGVSLGTLDSGWQVAGVGDFNGDGRSDILWRNTNGAIVVWDTNANGGVSGVGLGTLDSSWQVAGVGDFNGDAKADILWRNTSGAIVLWNSNNTGGFTGVGLGTLDASWQIQHL